MKKYEREWNIFTSNSKIKFEMKNLQNELLKAFVHEKTFKAQVQLKIWKVQRDREKFKNTEKSSNLKIN